MTWVFINEDAINDSAPTGPGLREESGTAASSATSVVWNENSREELMEAVVDESRKRRKLDDAGSFVPIDWSVVAKRVGNGASALDCERVFLSLPLENASNTERSITPEATSSDKEESSDKGRMDLSEQTLKDIVHGSRPEVIKAATDAALKATDNLAEAQKAAVCALVASEAAVRAREEEDAVSRLLVELQEQRLQKLENRLALLDDIEGVLEAERVALELERRDLYTARCRHWFGGGA
jgi:SWI/SNF related-matrix-associated actin-dependent regulator of chromatin subfamily C